MKAKTSVSLSTDVLEELDEVAGPAGRSAFIERLVRAHLAERRRAADFERQVALLNAVVDGRDPPDTEAHSVDPFEPGDDAVLLVDLADEAG